MSEHRILVVTHGHPSLSVGGGELAAYTQWTELRRRGYDALFVAWTPHSAGHIGAPFSLRSPDGAELLFAAPPVDHFKHSQPQRRIVYEDFRGLLDSYRPTAVHFHHYVHLGLEMIREVRKFSSSIPIVLTLHEFLALCHAQGQMLKTDGTLCQRAAPLDCHICFPNISPQQFFMRELFVKSFLSLVDHFVCPSVFLRNRYVEWGLPAERMHFLENGQPQRAAGQDGESVDAKLKNKFVLLGQLSRLKGTLVLLRAIRLLRKTVRELVRIEIHGLLRDDTDEFKNEFNRMIADLQDTVTYCGPYRPEDVGSIIGRNGWVVVPSIWWENSPIVIQEAFAAGRPVICGNVGGMAEKVTSGVNGLHFRIGSAADLAARIEECVTTPALWDALRRAVQPPPSVQDTVDALLPLYGIDAKDGDAGGSADASRQAVHAAAPA